MDDQDASAENSGVERQRQAAALNHLLGEIGLTGASQTRWWNLVGHPELGGRTATQAWLDGDHEAVRSLVEKWYAATKSAAERVAGSPSLLRELRERLGRIPDGGRLHRSA